MSSIPSFRPGGMPEERNTPQPTTSAKGSRIQNLTKAYLTGNVNMANQILDRTYTASTESFSKLENTYAQSTKHVVVLTADPGNTSKTPGAPPRAPPQPPKDWSPSRASSRPKTEDASKTESGPQIKRPPKTGGGPQTGNVFEGAKA